MGRGANELEPSVMVAGTAAFRVLRNGKYVILSGEEHV